MSPIAAKTYTTEIICMRSYDYGEADKILHFYSPEHGRISAIAKGVKKAKSKLAGACEILNLSEVQLSKGKNLDLLCQYQPKETFMGIRSDLLKLAYALLFLELVNLTAGEADSHWVYADLKSSLHRLDQAHEAEILPLAIHYQRQLLEAEGYQPILNQCIFTQAPLEEQAVYYCFSPQLGGVTTPKEKQRYQQQNNQVGGGHETWVNISTSTLRLLANPFDSHWQPSHFLKAQKFLQFYLHQIMERSMHANTLVLNLLETLVRSSEN